MGLPVKPLLGFLGRIARGVATKIGVAGVAGGVALNVTAPAFAIDPATVAAIQAAAKLVAEISALVAMFGIGRKAGAAVPEVAGE